jgi:hypothetical protein
MSGFLSMSHLSGLFKKPVKKEESSDDDSDDDEDLESSPASSGSLPDTKGWRLVITGHSLGAGCASLLALALKHDPLRLPRLALLLALHTCLLGLLKFAELIHALTF